MSVNSTPNDPMRDKRILFVDDETMILEAFERQLGEAYNVHTASSGANALSLLKRGDRFAIIVADMRMPNMDGIEFLVRARVIDPEFVPIMLTGNMDRGIAFNAIEKGQVFHFLTKPCNNERLISAVEASFQLYDLQRRISKIKSFLKEAA